MSTHTGHLEKSYHKPANIMSGKWVNEEIKKFRRLGYSDEYINKELGHLVNWRI